ncbi:C25 family cysteine peptidase [Telluribacter sp. SYSU D00476]|uniref:putative type IX secretion system sortase PorU2 n=1 Tax=Telluribacter sp. SYSU D00476 TaxID=2811430 RepID=UPI001FF699B0|nr:C25 family cysteine peptidase [Telluribacter sp. SYSU D00476]
MMPHPLRTCLFITILLLSTAGLRAQLRYGNEWIQPQQTYLRIPIVQTGWYRLSPAELERAGVPVASIPARSLQLFRRGEEVAIQVTGEADGRLDANDLIEFYGEKNDGALDSLLYVTPAAQPHTHYSLYSDTAAYFLTWRTDGMAGRRIARAPQTTTPGTTLNEYLAKELHIIKESYPAGRLYPEGSGYDDGTALTPYDYGEGWTSTLFKTGTWKSFTLPITDINRASSQQVQVEVLLTSHSAHNHRAEVWLGTAQNPVRKLGELAWKEYASVVFEATLPVSEVPSTGLVLSVVPREEREELSVGYLSVLYPRVAQLSATQQLMYFPAQQANATLNLNASGSPFFVDVSDPARPRLLTSAATATDIQVPLAGSSTVLSVHHPFAPVGIQRVNYKAIDPTQTNYLIISHPLLRQPVQGAPDAVQAYADYRASAAGGGYHPLVLNAQEVFDQFNYGEPGPHGIRRLISWLHDKGKLQHVFLIGQARDPQTARHMANARSVDMVPTAGWPGSDIALSMGLGGAPADVPLVPVGRLQASTGRTVWDYLQKVKQHEAQPALAPWRKKVLHLSGGRTVPELSLFRGYVDFFKHTVDSSYLGPVVQTLSKQTDEPVEKLDLQKYINEGVALMTMFGHSSLDVTDIELGDPTNDALGYRNKDRYPAILMNGCALGNFYFGPTTTSTRWVNAPERGAVLFVAHTHNGRPFNLMIYTSTFYEVLTDPAYVSQPFGTIQQEAIRRLMQNDQSEYARATVQQMTLQGDPAIRLFPARLPDYAWRSGTLEVSSPNGSTPNAISDSLRVQAVVSNYGRYNDAPYTLLIRRIRNNAPIGEYHFIRPAVAMYDTLTLYVPRLQNAQGGDEQWELVLDPQNQINEEDKSNNHLTADIYIAEGRATPLIPAANATLAAPTIHLVAQVPYQPAGHHVVFEWDISPDFTSTSLQRDTVLSREVQATLPITVAGRGAQAIYWRVYIAGEQPSLPRAFTYNPQAQASPALPEGVAFIKNTPPAQAPEGATVQPELFFQNVTEVAFRDSVIVVVRQQSPTGTEEQQYRIAPVPARTTVSIKPVLNTLGKAGINRVQVRFNVLRQPEHVLTNNSTEIQFTVVPDRTPPVLDVLVDGRRPTHGEAVSPRPVFTVHIMDENKTLLRRDTTNIQLWLQGDCHTCTFQRLWLRQAEWSATPTQHFTLWLRPDTPLPAGNYILHVEALDLTGNMAAPYRVEFRVSDTTRVVSTTVSPVPALLWVKFQIELEGPQAPEHWRIHITDAGGRQVATLEQEPHLGLNELLWDVQALPPGLYLYRMEVAGAGWDEVRKGKLIKQ